MIPFQTGFENTENNQIDQKIAFARRLAINFIYRRVQPVRQIPAKKLA
jgi:hypothetical protein